MSLVAALLLTCGWALNVAAIASCEFVTLTNGLGTTEQDLVYALGLYTVQGSGGYCYVVNWNDFTQNIPYWTNRQMNSARICGAIAAFIGFIMMIVAWFLPCFGGAGRCIRITLASCAFISGILVSHLIVRVVSALYSGSSDFRCSTRQTLLFSFLVYKHTCL